MGNLNSRETMQLLENEEFKHVCRNLGDFFRHHGEYVQHRRHKSRKDRSHHEETKDHGRGKSGEVSPELVKDLNWNCPGGVDCPMHKFVTERFLKNPPKAVESRHNVNQQNHRPRSEIRHPMSYPPQPNGGRNPSGRPSQLFPNPQNGPSNWPSPRHQPDHHSSYPHPPFNDPYSSGPVPDPDLDPDPEIDPQAMETLNHPNFQPAHATTASTSSSAAAFHTSPLPRHGPPAPGHATRPRARGNRGPPPLAREHPPHEQFNATAAGGRSGSNRGFEFERDSPRGGQSGEERHLSSGGMGLRHGFLPPPGGGRRLDPGRRMKRKYRAGAVPGTADLGVAGPGLGLPEGEGGGFWGSPSRVEEEEEERDQEDGANAGQAESDGGRPKGWGTEVAG